MLRFSVGSLLLAFALMLVGCGGSTEPAAGFDQDELAKYAAENPAPYIDGSSGESVDDVK